MILNLPPGLRLTEIRPSDQEALVEHLSQDEIYRCTLRVPRPYTADDAERWLAMVAKATREHGQPGSWGIRNDAEQLVGSVGMERGAGPQSHRAEIGYWLARSYWGQGVMTAAVQAVCRIGFAEQVLQKITAHVFSFNGASAKVLQKCGFTEEGYFRRHYVKDGELIDARAFGLLREDGMLD